MRAVVVLLMLAGIGKTDTEPRHLYFLVNGHFQFDNGPELNRLGLRAEIVRMCKENPPPQVRLQPPRGAKYGQVAVAVKEFQQFGCGGLGFVGN